MNFINRLPKDIISRILPYTYHTQTKKLLNDVVQYKEAQVQLLDLYHTYWSQYDISLDECKHWLINDMFAYANHDKPTMYGYVHHFYTLFNRNPTHSIENLENYLKQFSKKEVNTQINLLLGMFNLYERRDLFHECSLRLVAFESD